MGFLTILFGGKKHEIISFIKRKAILLDVRTQKEFDNGHIKNTLHIPMQEIDARLNELKELQKPIIAFCESGVRSAKITKLLKKNGIDTINGGGWKPLQKLLSKI